MPPPTRKPRASAPPARPDQFRWHLLEAVFEGSHLGIGVSRAADGRFIEVNTAFLRLFGYRREEVLGRTSLELGLWPEPGERAALLERLRAGEVVTAYEARFRRKNGETGYLAVSARMVDWDGDRHMIGILTDITERRRVEAALRDSESRLRLALEATRLLVFRQDQKLRYSWIANPSLGLSGTDIIGRTDAELLGREAAAPLVRIKNRAMRQGRGAREEVWVQRDGQAGCFDLIVEPERDAGGKVVGVLCAAADITERKRAEAELRMHSDILAHLEEGVNLVDGAGVIRYTNPNFDALFGYGRGELIGRHASVLNAPDERTPEETARAILAALERDGVWQGEIHNRRKDGAVFWTRANIVTVRHPQLGMVWVSVQTDITALRRLRLERDAAHHALERLTSHVQDEIEDLRREIAREVHDQIGAALTGIRMGLENLAHAAEPAPALDRLHRLVDRAMVDTRELCTRLRPSTLDELGLAETCRWYLRDWSGQTGIRVASRLARLSVEPADSLRTDLFRVLQELLTNVARHAGARRVSVTLGGSRAGVRLKVADDGHGFTADGKEGFGLIGIRERLRRHGGRMDLDTGPAGTTVIVRVPGARP